MTKAKDERIAELEAFVRHLMACTSEFDNDKQMDGADAIDLLGSLRDRAILLLPSLKHFLISYNDAGEHCKFMCHASSADEARETFKIYHTEAVEAVEEE